MATKQLPSRYALIVTGHAGPLGPDAGLLETLADHAGSGSGGSAGLPGYTAFVADEHYHFVAPFGSFADLGEWPSLARALGGGGQASLNERIDAAFAGVDTQILEYREDYSNWSAGTPVPDELVATTLSVDPAKWSEFHAASRDTVREMKDRSGRQWITFSNRTGDVSKFHVVVDAAAEGWGDSAGFARLLGTVGHTVSKRLVHKPGLGTLN